MCKDDISKPIRKIDSWSSGNLKRERGRLKMTWRTGLEKNTKDLDLQIKMVEN